MDSRKYPPATLVVVFYRQQAFVREAVAGALAQDYPNLEIVFSDDASPDDSYQEILKAVEGYDGPHKVIINRNERNMGLVPHINKVLSGLSHGEFIFLNGGDDISAGDRVSAGINYFLSSPEITAITGSCIYIDKDGNETGQMILDKDSLLNAGDTDYLSTASFMTGGVALAFRRQVMDEFGPLGEDCQTEDSTLRFRALLLGPALRSSKVFLKYRRHGGNLSSDIFKLKIDKIAAQYRRDLEHIRGKLSPALYQELDRKISYFVRLRHIQEKESKCPRLLRRYYELRASLLKKSYLRSI